MTRGGPPTQSGSLVNPDYWWYRARRELLAAVLAGDVSQGSTILEVGSADGPSVGWLAERGRRCATDIDPRGLPDGGVCASALQLPFRADTFDVLAAFDVIEHIDDETAALAEVARVLVPGGRLLVSVPAYQWAWSDMDNAAGHVRRYTRQRLVSALRAAGFTVDRATYMFTGTFPAFAFDRLRSRLTKHRGERVATSALPAWQERMLLRLCKFDAALLRRTDLPAGSSVVASARAAPN